MIHQTSVLLPQPGSLHTLNPSLCSPKAFLIKAYLNTVLIQLENITSQRWYYHTCLMFATAATISIKFVILSIKASSACRELSNSRHLCSVEDVHLYFLHCNDTMERK